MGEKQYLEDTWEELTGLFMRLVQRLDRVHTTAIVYVKDHLAGNTKGHTAEKLRSHRILSP